jgi:hydroxymethylpyrimidine pyrophosphatase-like HAD family hydrolase
MVYCFDLDGTLCNTDGNNYNDSTPKKKRIEKVNELYEEGNTIIIDTARGSVSGKNYFFFTVNQLKSWGVKFHTVRTGVKIGADIFIDDKGIQDQIFFKD